jgi:hypothetical protein
MKRRAWLLFFAVSLVCAAPQRAAADLVLLSFSGFDYEDPNPSGTYLDLGEGYKALGDVTSVDPVLLGPYVDFGTKEYTFHMFNLSVNGRFFTFPNLTVTFVNNGRGRYYEDDQAPVGTHRTYGVNPPNATAPSTFIDGPGPPPNPVKLGGDIDNFVLTYNFNTNSGNFQGDMTLDEGSALIYIPPGQRSGWILGGLAGPPNDTIAPGYSHQINGECRVPTTPATRSTWGTIKSLYR